MWWSLITQVVSAGDTCTMGEIITPTTGPSSSANRRIMIYFVTLGPQLRSTWWSSKFQKWSVRTTRPWCDWVAPMTAAAAVVLFVANISISCAVNRSPIFTLDNLPSWNRLIFLLSEYSGTTTTTHFYIITTSWPCWLLQSINFLNCYMKWYHFSSRGFMWR